MKKNIISLAFLVCFTTLFISCNKDDAENSVKESASISFSAVINNMVTNKTHLDAIPECSEAVPLYVEVVLSGEMAVGTAESPQMISIAPDLLDFDEDGVDEYISEILELRQGIYTLESFNIFDSNDNLIYMAPKTDDTFGQFVSNPLPQTIIIDTYEDYFLPVDIVCFDNRTLIE